MSMEVEKQHHHEYFDENAFIRAEGITLTPGSTEYDHRTLASRLKEVTGEHEYEQYFPYAVDVVKRYLNLKRVNDHFDTDHDSRRRRRLDNVAKYGKPFIDFYQNDGRRVNKLSSLLMAIDVCIRYAKRMKESPERTALLSLGQTRPDLSTYQSMPTEERDTFLDGVVTYAKKFLDIVTD